MTTQKLSVGNLFLVGFTLFSMFFGAGNLIFPPYLASQAGTLTWPAMAGFLVSAVGLPILGVAAVALSGGLPKLSGKVGKHFAFLFTLVIYLSIGPFLAIPRTASTSFEMTLLPILTGFGIRLDHDFLFTGVSIRLAAQTAYSALFFFVAMLLAFRPEKLTDRLGKILTPSLLILIAVIFTGCLIWPFGPYAEPAEIYRKAPQVKGFLEGYQTMDTIAALNFGIIIALNIKEKGVSQDGAVVRETIKAGVIAGVLLTLVYTALAHIGAPVGVRAGEGVNGARILTFVAGNLFGRAGMIILGIIFFIACLNTCVGLLSCCSQYFSTLLPRISYRSWVVIFAVVSLVISSAGLDRIVKFSVPVLNTIYPLAIVLIILSFLGRFLGEKRYVYPLAILFTGIVSVVYAAENAGLAGAVKSLGTFLGKPAWMERVLGVCTLAGRFFNALPGYEQGLGWLLPAAAGIVLGMILSGKSANGDSQ